jgi:hypothetical protein
MVLFDSRHAVVIIVNDYFKQTYRTGIDTPMFGTLDTEVGVDGYIELTAAVSVSVICLHWGTVFLCFSTMALANRAAPSAPAI